MKNKLSIVDSNFKHSKIGYSSDIQNTDVFEWNRNSLVEPIVYTDKHIDKKNKNNSYAWLIEPYSIDPNIYKTIKNYNRNFTKVFTHDKTLLDLGENYDFIYVGGCWIDDDDKIIHNKSKNLSIIASNKNKTAGHKLRQEVIRSFSNHIDIFGRGHNPINKKIKGLKDYRFSVVIENTKRDYYFTEKIIDCFITGTVPIYWGCPSIVDFFDLDGILTFNSIEELSIIIDKADTDLYNKLEKHIKNNYKLSKNFLLPDIEIYKKIKNDI